MKNLWVLFFFLKINIDTKLIVGRAAKCLLPMDFKCGPPLFRPRFVVVPLFLFCLFFA